MRIPAINIGIKGLHGVRREVNKLQKYTILIFGGTYLAFLVPLL
jgi:hypothetical protein